MPPKEINLISRTKPYPGLSLLDIISEDSKGSRNLKFILGVAVSHVAL